MLTVICLGSGTCDQALTIEGRRRRLSPEARLALGEWMVVTERRVANLRAMPDKAQKACSAPLSWRCCLVAFVACEIASIRSKLIMT